MKTFAILTAAVVIGSGANAEPCSLASLGWMAGSWRDDSNPTMKVEERWVVGPDDRIIGSSWLLHPGRPGGVIEAMTIVADGNDVLLRIRHFDATLAAAREEKDAPMVFAATECEPNAVTFEGRGDRTGEKMHYRRDGQVKHFVGEFIHAGEPVRVEETFTEAGEH